MSFMRRPGGMVLAIGTAIAVTMTGIALLFMNPAECPTGYTQQQIDQSGCNVGDNIGLGPVLLLALIVLVITLLWAADLRNSHQDK